MATTVTVIDSNPGWVSVRVRSDNVDANTEIELVSAIRAADGEVPVIGTLRLAVFERLSGTGTDINPIFRHVSASASPTNADIMFDGFNRPSGYAVDYLNDATRPPYELRESRKMYYQPLPNAGSDNVVIAYLSFATTPTL